LGNSITCIFLWGVGLISRTAWIAKPVHASTEQAKTFLCISAEVEYGPFFLCISSSRPRALGYFCRCFSCGEATARAGQVVAASVRRSSL
jgi:hypothetical protein